MLIYNLIPRSCVYAIGNDSDAKWIRLERSTHFTVDIESDLAADDFPISKKSPSKVSLKHDTSISLKKKDVNIRLFCWGG